jgi:hypothetical protein
MASCESKTFGEYIQTLFKSDVPTSEISTAIRTCQKFHIDHVIELQMIVHVLRYLPASGDYKVLCVLTNGQIHSSTPTETS